MTLLGIGSARINLVLPKDTFKPGEDLKGEYHIKGGVIEQKIKRIDCELIKMKQDKKIEQTFDAPTILTSKLIQSEQSYKIPFTFRLASTLPASTDEISYRFYVKLTFSEGVESKDQVAIRVI